MEMNANSLFIFVIAVFWVYNDKVLGVVLRHVDGKITEVIKIASDACDILPLDFLFSRPLTSLEPNQLDVVEFTQDRRRRSYRLSKAHLRIQEYPIPWTLVIYIPGWWNTPNDESSQAVINALLIRHPYVLLIDTQDAFSRGYVSSAARVKPLSKSLYSFIEKLSQIGVDPSILHIIGFSLGAHVAGLAGKISQRRLNRSIGKITALDPAKPCFSRPAHRLQRDDANFVHAIHSSPGVVGLKVPVGHLDVYINGVSGTQPECRGRSLSAQCDHSMSWRLYIASVNDSSALLGRYCDNWNDLVDRNCNGIETVVGYDTSSNLRGLYLYTSSYVALRRRQVLNPLDGRTWWDK